MDHVDNAASASGPPCRSRSAVTRRHKFDLAARTLLARAGKNMERLSGKRMGISTWHESHKTLPQMCIRVYLTEVFSVVISSLCLAEELKQKGAGSAVIFITCKIKVLLSFFFFSLERDYTAPCRPTGIRAEGRGYRHSRTRGHFMTSTWMRSWRSTWMTKPWKRCSGKTWPVIMIFWECGSRRYWIGLPGCV